MKDRAGFFAGCADSLTELCAYYIVAGIFIMSNRGWGLHLGWILLCTALCGVVFSLLLRKPRSFSVLAVMAGVLFAAVLAVFMLVSLTPMKFGYIFVLAVGSGMAVGCPLNYAVNRPQMHKHLMRLDVLILVMVALLLCREALGIDVGTVALMVVVLFMDAAAAVGLRMTEGGAEDTQSAFKAIMVALGGFLGLSAVIAVLVVVFSRSGAVTGAVLRGIASGFRAVGRVFENFFRWLSSLIKIDDTTETLHLEEVPSLAELDRTGRQMGWNLDPVILAVIAGVLVLAAVIALVLYLRKKTFVRGTKTVRSPSNTVMRRKNESATLWEKLKEALRFRWTAFLKRNTPGGVLVYTERLARRRRASRKKGESMRSFLRRMDASGGLDGLADALDREYYGGMSGTMTARSCRETRRYIRKVVQHG